MTFQESKEYGNDLTIKVLKRTEKTITIETIAWGVQRVKVRKNADGSEFILYKAWLIYASDIFDAEESKKIAYERAYS
tara:strand:- start:2213 stop:2446 length:234 start_codon:yes stop_codon:yes gene_type:complete